MKTEKTGFLLGETPPRAWGRLLNRPADANGKGNTPTGVGKTRYHLRPKGLGTKHPHGRGEDRQHLRRARAVKETPPRAWGRRRRRRYRRAFGRNTPTGVGKTGAFASSYTPYGKHPHGRGEDLEVELHEGPTLETPPRAWGRRVAVASLLEQPGNTPTGVGKTLPPCPSAICTEKHPHGRGEDCGCQGPCQGLIETPPRAWGRLINSRCLLCLAGNTPTGVGKTPPSRLAASPQKKHPHGRGEDVETSNV